MSTGREPTIGNTVLTAREAFGLGITCGFALGEFPPTRSASCVDVSVNFAIRGQPETAFSGPADPPAARIAATGDGCYYRIERGRRGDHLITYSDRATFHLSHCGRKVQCAPRDPGDPAWRRFLLDTVLGTASLIHGFEALHAGAWLSPQGLIAIVAGTGSGKSTTVAEMVRRGHPLFCDDIFALSQRDGRVLGHPGPPLMNLPPSLPDGTPAGRLGRVVANIDGESWTLIDRPVVKASPVTGVVFLERRPCAAHVEVERLPSSAAALLANSLGSGSSATRLASRFGLFSDLARQAHLLRVKAPFTLPPSELADMVEAGFNLGVTKEAS